MALKKKYQSQKTAIATYDYTDIASGTGYKIFYAGDLSGSETLHNLSPNQFYGDVGFTSGSIGLETFDLDFDVEFNRPVIIKGDAIVNIPIWYTASGVGTIASIFTASIRKVTTAGETDLASGSVLQSHVFPGADSEELMAGIRVVVPHTEFKKDDKLRLTILNTISAQGGTVYMGHDPMSRLTILNGPTWTVTTATTAHIPFVIDV